MKARDLLRRGGPVLGLLLVCAIFAFLIGPQFFRPVNLELIARQTAIVCTAALGMTMIIVAAGIDLSVGSIIALSTVVIALLLKRDVSPLLAALGGVAAAAACGLANGVLITRLKVVPFIVTLGTMLIVRGAAKAVLVASSDLAELLGLCDRIAVMCRGRLGPPRPAAEWDEHALMMAATGAGDAA